MSGTKKKGPRAQQQKTFIDAAQTDLKSRLVVASSTGSASSVVAMRSDRATSAATLGPRTPRTGLGSRSSGLDNGRRSLDSRSGGGSSIGTTISPATDLLISPVQTLERMVECHRAVLVVRILLEMGFEILLVDGLQKAGECDTTLDTWVIEGAAHVQVVTILFGVTVMHDVVGHELIDTTNKTDLKIDRCNKQGTSGRIADLVDLSTELLGSENQAPHELIQRQGFMVMSTSFTGTIHTLGDSMIVHGCRGFQSKLGALLASVGHRKSLCSRKGRRRHSRAWDRQHNSLPGRIHHLWKGKLGVKRREC